MSARESRAEAQRRGEETGGPRQLNPRRAATCLLASENPPECGCFLVQQLFATKHQGYTVGLIRNAVFIVGLCYAWRLARIGIKPVPGAESAG